MLTAQSTKSFCFYKPGPSGSRTRMDAVPSSASTTRRKSVPCPATDPRQDHYLHPDHTLVKMTATKSNWFVEQTVAENSVVIFSKTSCPFSAKAKDAVRQLLEGSQFLVVEVDQCEDGDGILDALKEVTGGRSTPRVFIGGVFIGGGDDTVRKAETGELQRLLKEAGVLPKIA